MATWQWSEDPKYKPVVPTDKGWQVGSPDKGKATEARHTAVLTDQDGNRAFLWLHEIAFNFEVAGQYAQSHRWRNWYPRNFVQPRVQVQGQCPNQQVYAELCEFIRSSQQKSLRHSERDATRKNALGFSIGAGGKHYNHKHQGHHFRGHILNMPRIAERFVFAPEYAFEFVIVAAYSGIFSTGQKDAKAGADRMAMAMQMPLEDRPQWVGTKNVTFISDPDILLEAQAEERLKEAIERKKREEERLAKAQQVGALIPGFGETGGGSGTPGNTYEGSPVPGQRPHAATHETGGLPGYPAYDYMAPAGTPCVAPTDGKVARLSGKDPSEGGPPGGPLGYSIYFDGDNGKKYFLTHLDKVSVIAGNKVKQGTQIAEVANGPKSWSSPHVHMGVNG